jgi:hypothetical protein
MVLCFWLASSLAAGRQIHTDDVEPGTSCSLAVAPLAETARLLADTAASTLISGANRMTSRDDLIVRAISGGDVRVCVDIGYEAQDTPGNADETMQWATDKRFSRLIIVTSSYHMPRSLTELGRVMPNVAFVPYPVVTEGFRKERWWRDFGTARILLSEYVKFLPSAARFGMARLLRTLDGSALADDMAAHGADR